MLFRSEQTLQPVPQVQRFQLAGKQGNGDAGEGTQMLRQGARLHAGQAQHPAHDSVHEYGQADDGLEQRRLGRLAVQRRGWRSLASLGMHGRFVAEYPADKPACGKRNFGSDPLPDEQGGAFSHIKSEMSLILECKEKKKLTDFYETNHFKQFGRRKLDRDETDIKGGYLLQYFAIL